MGVREGKNWGRKEICVTFSDCARTEFPTKFVPFIFIISQYCPTVKQILPDWLCLPNKLGGCPPPPSRYFHDPEYCSDSQVNV